MAALATIVPPIEWSQRKDGLYVVIKVAEAQDVQVDLQATSLKFACDADEKKYAFDVTFAAEVLPDESVWKVHGRSIQMHVVKKDQEADHWCRLTNDKVFEKRHVATDWSRYVDEDEESGDDGFDMSALEGAANFGSAEGDVYEPDSDDEPPARRPAKKARATTQDELIYLDFVDPASLLPPPRSPGRAVCARCADAPGEVAPTGSARPAVATSVKGAKELRVTFDPRTTVLEVPRNSPQLARMKEQEALARAEVRALGGLRAALEHTMRVEEE